jgi:hypothetical protein
VPDSGLSTGATLAREGADPVFLTVRLEIAGRICHNSRDKSHRQSKQISPTGGGSGMSAETVINIPVKLDKVTFRRFAVFDTFRRQRRWRAPVLFLVILTGFSIFLFFQADKPQSGLIGGVLLAVGLGLPLVYFSSFFISLRENVIKHCMPRQVYTLTLTDKGVHILSNINNGEELTLDWNQLFAAYRVKGAVYLYVLPTRAFLLPDGQADAPDDELWAFLKQKLRDKCRSFRRK